MPARRLPDTETLKSLLAEGTPWATICERYGVTKQALHQTLRREGLISDESPHAVRYDDAIPWKVKLEHAGLGPVRMLRLAARRDSGQELSEADAAKLNRWLAKLAAEDAVVDYTREPHPADPTVVGFYYTKRRPGIDTGLIREPEDRVRART